MDKTDDARPPKRRKIRLACQECRDKKTRCDGGRPVCNACQRKGLGPQQCIYLDTASDVDSHYVKSLEERIRELERSKQHQEHADSINRFQAPTEEISAAPDHDLTCSGGDNGLGGTARELAIAPESSSNDRHIAAIHLMDLQNHHGNHDNSFNDFNDVRANQTRAFTPPLISYDRAAHQVGMSSPVVRDEDRDTLNRRRDIDGQTDVTPHLYRGHRDRSDWHSQGYSGQEDNDKVTPGDAMGASEGTPNESGRTVFLGPSSAAAFMKTVQETTGRRLSNQHGLEDGASSTTSRASQRRTRKSRNVLAALLSDLTMPPRRLADTYLESYWNDSHLFYPILHRPSFVKRYDHLWSRADTNEDELHLFDGSVHKLRAFYATLNIVLALGCLFAQAESPSSNTGAKTFFERSQSLLKDADVDQGSIQLVQAFILTAQYLQSTDKVNKCWVTVGIAIRVAQGIGVQLDRRTESQAEREERKRTWWCCLLMDRVLSMTFGRPPMVVWPTEVPLPQPIDDDMLSQEVGSSVEPLQFQETSLSSFFTHTLKLSDILMSVLRHLYRPLSERKRSMTGESLVSDISLIVEVDNDMARWRYQLPGHLIHGPTELCIGTDSPAYNRQAAVLHARYLHLRTLLFRPITMELSSGEHFTNWSLGRSTDFQNATLCGCMRSCVWAAEELVDLIHNQINTDRMPPWWYSIFYVYSSATVLLSVLLSTQLQQAYREDPSRLANAWTRCMETLLHFDNQGSTFARNCRQILQFAIDPKPRGRNTLANDEFNPNEHDGTRTVGRANDQEHQQVYFVDDFESVVNDGTFPDILWPAGGQDWLNSLPEDRGEIPPVAHFAMP